MSRTTCQCARKPNNSSSRTSIGSTGWRITIKHWRVDALKIDRSFVQDLVTDSSDLAIVSAIIAIARHLQIQVIAEGIEGYQQAEILRRLGCAVGQGFLFARPMTAEQCLKLLREDAATDKAEDEDMLAAFSAGRG
jgi:predicted signal transduction protein with EAL and GGDEF domain